MTLKTRAKWVKEHDDLEKGWPRSEEEFAKVTRGDPKDMEAKTPSIFSVRAKN